MAIPAYPTYAAALADIGSITDLARIYADGPRNGFWQKSGSYLVPIIGDRDIHIIKGSAAWASTNTTSEEVVLTVPMPALKVASYVIVRSMFACVNNSGVKTARVRIGAAGAGTGGTALFSQTLTSLARGYSEMRFQNQDGVTNSQAHLYGSSAQGTVGSSASAMAASAIQTNVPFELAFTTIKDAGGDAFSLESYEIEIHP